MNVLRVLCVVVVNFVLAGCSYHMATKAVLPTSHTSYNNVFSAAAELVTRSGYTVSRADKSLGMITGVKQIGGSSLNFNMFIKRIGKSGIEVNLVREGGSMPMPNVAFKADARIMLKGLSQLANVPENKIIVTMDGETNSLDVF